jgi:hypothetical protein
VTGLQKRKLAKKKRKRDSSAVYPQKGELAHAAEATAGMLRDLTKKNRTGGQISTTQPDSAWQHG